MTDAVSRQLELRSRHDVWSLQAMQELHKMDSKAFHGMLAEMLLRRCPICGGSTAQ